MNLNAGLSATLPHFTLRFCSHAEQFWHKGALQAMWLLGGRREHAFSRADPKLGGRLLIRTATNLCRAVFSLGPASLAVFAEVGVCQ